MRRGLFSIMFMLCGCLAAVGQSEVGLQQVFFRVGSAVLDANTIPQSMIDSVEAVCARGEKYTVLGVASPEGSYKANVRLATKRAQAIVSHLAKRTGLSDSMFNVKTMVAGMDKLLDLARQDENLPDKEQILEILAAEGSTGAKLAKLKKLGDGTPYLYIKDRLFPYLRASVTSNQELEDFHPDLAGIFQPQKEQVQHAATQKIQSRHSSLNKVASPAVSTSKSEPKEVTQPVSGSEKPVPVSAKADSVKPEKPSEAPSAAPVKSDEKILTETSKADTTVPMWLWLVVALLGLALLGLVIFYRRKVSRLNDELADAQGQLRQKDLQLKNAQDRLEESQKQMEILKKEQKKTSLYNDGESLFNHLLIGGVTYEWTAEQTRTLIEYYKLQNYPLIHRLESEYDNLPLNHILFEVLVDMGKSDQEIQRIMNISQTTIRSYRFRIKSKKI